MEDLIAGNYAVIQRRVAEAAQRAGRDAGEVTIVGVTKMKPAEVIRVAVKLGLANIGENYAQECAAKRDELPDPSIRWHFIGSLQRNKVRLILPFVHLIHAVDSQRLAAEIDRQAGALGRSVPVLLQVNTSGEASKHGVPPESAPDILRQLRELRNLELRGLMTLAAELPDPGRTRPMFALLRNTRNRLQDSSGISLPELSMGMSGDFEIAIEEGATMVRIGSSIFGSRT